MYVLKFDTASEYISKLSEKSELFSIYNKTKEKAPYIYEGPFLRAWIVQSFLVYNFRQHLINVTNKRVKSPVFSENFTKEDKLYHLMQATFCFFIKTDSLNLFIYKSKRKILFFNHYSKYALKNLILVSNCFGKVFSFSN